MRDARYFMSGSDIARFTFATSGGFLLKDTTWCFSDNPYHIFTIERAGKIGVLSQKNKFFQKKTALIPGFGTRRYSICKIVP